MATVDQPVFKIFYKGKSVTEDFTPYLISVTYTDKVIGESDEIEISLMDPDGRWREGWYPVKGDRIKLQMGYKDAVVDCGEFEVDEIGLSGPPDVVNIRGIASWVTSAIRTRDSNAHENKTLKEIAETICKRNGLILDDGTRVATTNIKYDFNSESKITSDVSAILSQASTAGDTTALKLIVESITKLRSVVASIKSKRQSSYIDELSSTIDVLQRMSANTSVDYSSFSVILDGIVTVFLNTTIARLIVLKKLSSNMEVLSKAMAKNNVNKTTSKVTKKGDLYTLRLARSTQNNETDLAYLKRICSEFGFIFNIRGNRMFISSIYELEDGKPVLEIDRTDMISYDIKDKTSETYSSAVSKYHDPKSNQLISVKVETQEGSDKVAFAKPVKSDTLNITSKAENKQQAELKARAALHSANSKQQELSCSVQGNPLLVAGNNIDVTGFGILSGRYHITQSTHRYDKSGGYITELQAKRVGFVLKVKQKAKKPRKIKYSYQVVS